MKLKDKVAIVTGGANGIGKAYIIGYAAEGAKVVIADIDFQAAKNLEDYLSKQGKEALAVKVDVTSAEETLEMAKQAMIRFGRIDILVNNASTVSRGGTVSRGIPFYELSLAEWHRLMEINVTGPFLCSRAVFPHIKAQGKGKIINVASGQYFVGGGQIKYAHYVTSKGAVIGLTRALARELGEYKINVNCIAPGSTLSEELTDEAAKKARERAISARCIKRVEYPEDLVGAAIFLASSDSDFITGQTFIIDGGDVFL